MKCDLADTLNSTWKNDKSAFGFRMLKKMGWKEDTGLGKNEDGRVDNVKLKIRDNCVGLGSEEVTDTSGNNHWGSSVESFENVLSLLKESYGTTTIKSKNKSKTVAKAKKNASYSVGIKYKKMKEAKNLSGKSSAEKIAILGTVNISENTIVTNDTIMKQISNKKSKKLLKDI